VVHPRINPSDRGHHEQIVGVGGVHEGHQRLKSFPGPHDVGEERPFHGQEAHHPGELEQAGFRLGIQSRRFVFGGSLPFREDLVGCDLHETGEAVDMFTDVREGVPHGVP